MKDEQNSAKHTNLIRLIFYKKFIPLKVNFQTILHFFTLKIQYSQASILLNPLKIDVSM